MKRTTFAVHLGIPALFTLGVFASVLKHEPFGVEMFSNYVLEAYFFYAAPHLLWAFITVVLKPSNAIAHAGFVASSIALVAIAALWLFPRDPSGLPMQWLLYWPLALILQATMTGLLAIYKHVRAA